MRIGLSTATFFGKLPVEDSFSLAKEFGAQAIEVFLTTYSEYLPAFGETLAARTEGLPIHSLHTLNSQFEPQLFHSVERTRHDAEAIFRMTLATAQKLGAKHYTFHGPARLKRKEYVFDFDSLGERMRGVCGIAEEYGVTVCYENVHWAYYYRPGYYRELKRRCPAMLGTLDVKQAFQGGEDWREFLAEMGRDIATVHVCDYLPDGRTVPIGRGIFPFPELFRRLREEGIKAPVLVELYSGDYTDFSEVADSLDYLKSL